MNAMNDEDDTDHSRPPANVPVNGPARRPKARVAPDVERLPPHSDEAERGVLGCILLAPADSLDIAQAVGLGADWFYDLRHRSIFHRITRLAACAVPVDLITLQAAMRDAGELESNGGLAYLSGLPDFVPSAANIGYYLDLLREKWTTRKALGTFTEAIGSLHNADEAALVIEEVFRNVEALADGATPRRAASLKELMPDVIDEIEDGYHRGSAQIKGLTTGLDYLDKLLCGIGGRHGNGIVLAARPGVGKSALGMQIAMHVAMEHKWFTPQKDAEGKIPLNDLGKPAGWEEHRGLPVGVFSLEMGAEELATRLMFQRSGVDAQRFKTGFASKDDFDRLTVAATELVKAPIHIDDDDGLTIDDLTARARLMVRQHGIKLFVVDYVQCLRVAPKRFRQDRVQEMAEISNGLRRLGKQLNVPLLVLAQMNRDFAKEKGVRKPRLEDLRDSGALEQDAHVVLFLYEEEMNAAATEAFEADVAHVMAQKGQKMGDWSSMPRAIEILVAKNRHGMNNKSSKLIFDGSCTRFEDRFVWKKRHGLKETAKGEPKRKIDDDML